LDSTRLYAIGVLAVALLATLMRLLRARSYAEAAYIRLQERRYRISQAVTGSLAIVVGTGLAVVATRQLYPVLFWLAAAVALLSGVQMLLGLTLRSKAQLLWLARAIGILFGGITVLIFFLLVR
jgi:hypothetical protein